MVRESPQSSPKQQPADTARRRRTSLQRLQLSGRVGLVVSCLLMAASLTAYRKALEPVSRRSRAVFRHFAQGKQRRYRLTAFTLQMIKDKYVDPTRLRPREMMISALDEIQRQVAEVMVIWPKKDDQVQVKVDIYRRAFDLSQIDSAATLYTALKELLAFVEKHIGTKKKSKEVEYAAINGLLNVLDPHSVLLSPEVYKNLKMGTRGSFGGLGIVISIRDGMLTVVSPIDDTPAFKAGIKPGDSIVKIGSEATINMTLNEAVNELRGDPGTKVVLWIKREGWTASKKFTITRAIIRIKSVASELLDDSIGFLRIKHFSRNTHVEVRDHLKKLKKKGARGLILGLYNNPGGLLDQAIRVADLFLDEGDVVTTVGYAGEKKETMKARKSTTVWRKPVAVLVNSGSASASEILAGALKGRGKAVVLGERTFGKGSVQVLFDNDDGSALKLTIRQYLTPGETSIQSVGIVPDVRCVPVTVKREKLKLFAPLKNRREQDLERHLNRRWGKGRQATPKAEVKYLAREREEKRTSEGAISGNAADHEVIRIASRLLTKNPRASRKEIFRNVKSRIAEVRKQQQERITTALKKLGVDWTVEPASKVPMLEAVLEAKPKELRVKAGGDISLSMKVTNLGLGPAFQVRALSSSISPLFDQKEFVFGRIDPGQTKKWTVKIHVPSKMNTQVIPVSMKFDEEYGHRPPPLLTRIQVKGHPRAVLACQYQLIDDLVGNRDGLVQKGERIRLRVVVRNIGEGPSLKTVLGIKNLSGPALFIRKGRVELGEMGVGQEGVADFVFDVRKGLTSRSLALDLSARDSTLRTQSKKRIVFSLSGNSRLVNRLQGWVEVDKKEAELRGGPDKNAPLIGWAEKGSVFRVGGRIHGWYRVELEKGRPAFLPLQKATKLPPTKVPDEKEAQVRRVFHLTPPLIHMATIPQVTKSHRLRVKGVAYDDRRIKDVFIEVIYVSKNWKRKKVFYKSNRFSSDTRRLGFSALVPLEDGLNYIRVVSRENDRVKNEITRVVLKKKGNPLSSKTFTPQRSRDL